VNNELERIWKEVMAKSEIQSWDLRGCTKDNYRKPQSEIACLQTDLNLGSPDCEAHKLHCDIRGLEDWHELYTKRW